MQDENILLLLAVQTLLTTTTAFVNAAASWPTAIRGQYNMTDFAFASGEKLDAQLEEMHYQTLAQLRVAPHGSGRTNAVLIMHGTTQSSDRFMSEALAAQFFNPGQRRVLSRTPGW